MLRKYYPGQCKATIRDYVYMHLLDSTQILTLPNLYFNLEKRFISLGKVVHCVENKLDIYEKQLMIAPDNVKLHYCDLSQLDGTQYDGFFLDMCGPLSGSAAKILKECESGSKLVLTLMMARESLLLKEYLNIKKRIPSYIELFSTFGISTQKYIEYNDGSPMCVFFLTKY